MTTKAVWTMLVFVLALLAIPAVGQDAVSVQDEIRATEVVVIHERVSAVEASQARAEREAIALQRRVASVTRTQKSLIESAKGLEKMTSITANKADALESATSELKRGVGRVGNEIRNLQETDAKLGNGLVNLDMRTVHARRMGLMGMALGVVSFSGIAAMFFWGVSLRNRVAILEKGEGRTEKLGTAISRRMDEEDAPIIPIVDERVVCPVEPPVATASPEVLVSVEFSKVSPEHDETTVLEMPSHEPSPSPADLVVVDEALARVRRPIVPIKDVSPTQPAA